MASPVDASLACRPCTDQYTRIRQLTLDANSFLQFLKRMTQIVEWPGDDSRQLLAQARSHIVAGRLVIVPTEIGYECLGNALDFDAVSKLGAFAGAAESVSLALATPVEVFDWLPLFRGVGPRLIRRFWPGPLIISSTGSEWGLL